MASRHPDRTSNDVLKVGLTFAGTFILSTLFQFVILEKLKGIVLASLQNFSVRSLGKWGLVRTVLGSIGTFDILVPAAMIALLGYLLFLQLNRRSISKFLGFILEDEKRIYLFILFISLLYLKPILAPGEPYLVDAPSHTSRAWFTYVNFRQGYWFPSFNNYYHNGFAMFSHYGYLFYVLAGGANLIFGNIFFSVKLTMLILSIVNAYLFYFLGKELFSNKGSGLLLSMIITGSNLYLYTLLWSGVLIFPLVLTGAALLLLSFEKLCNRKWSLYSAAFVSSVGANVLIATHLGYAAQTLLFFGVYVVARTIIFFKSDIRRMAVYCLFCILVGGLLSAFVFLPTILDIKDVNFFKAFPFSDMSTYRFWKVPFWQLVIPRPYYSDNYDYLGVALAGAFLAYLVARFRKRDRSFWFYLILILFSTSVLGYSRNTVFLLVALALFVLEGYTRITVEKDARLSVFTLLFMCLLVDSLVFNNFNTYNTSNQFEHRVYDNLALEKDGQKFGVVKANTLHSGNRESNDVFVSPWLKVVGHLVLQPNAIMLEANKHALYQFDITNDLLVRDVQSGAISKTTLQGLDMVGVKYLTFHNSTRYFIPSLKADPGVADNAQGPWIELPGASPLLFSQRVTNFVDLEKSEPLLRYRASFESDDVSHARAPFHYRDQAGAYVKKIIELTDPDMATAVASQFIARDKGSEDLSTPGPAELHVSRYDVDAQKVVLDFSINKSGFVRVPFGYFWYHKVTLNGQAAAFFPTVMNMICVKIDRPGDYELVIGPSLSPARKAGADISLAGLVLSLVALILFGGARKKRRFLK